MSYDFYIEKVCSHTIVDELCELDSSTWDRFAFGRRPSHLKCEIRMDGELIPESGLYSRAEVIFSKPEPYRIIANRNDLILFKNGDQAVRTIKLPPGILSAHTLSRYLLDFAPDLDWRVENGRVVVKTPRPNNGIAFSFPDPRWTDKSAALISTSRILNAYSLLGINPGRAASGRKIFPGYKVILDPANFVEQYIVVFETPIPNFVPTLTVTYTTLAPFCGRCQGSRIEYDYSVVTGGYDIVRNADLLRQELNKFIFTIKGSHWKWPWLGSNILNKIGTKSNPLNATYSPLLTLDISNAFNSYQSIKRQQDVYFPAQKVTDAEYPYNLIGINVTTGDDPTTYYALIDVQSRSFQPLQLTKELSTPDPIQLTSSPSGLMIQAGRGFQPVG
jgi:hypothetical protein